MIQRRRWERCRKELRLVIDPQAPMPITATTIDLCEGGVGILSAEAFEPGSTLRFEIREVADGAMTGIVRWCTPSRSGSGHVVGIEWEAQTSVHREALADKLAQWRSQAADEDG